jgi:acetyl-CoA synthetase
MIAASQLTRFMSRHGIAELADLHRRAIDDPQWFWDAVLADLGVEFFKPYDKVIDTSPGLPWTRWCVGGEMNIVHNCLDKWMGTPKERSAAIRWTTEEGTSGVLSYGELSQQVNRAANALRRLGFSKRDVIGIHMPMTPGATVAFFAIIKIGGIALPLFSGYGADPSRRVFWIRAKGLITADGTRRRGCCDPHAKACRRRCRAPRPVNRAYRRRAADQEDCRHAAGSGLVVGRIVSAGSPLRAGAPRRMTPAC